METFGVKDLKASIEGRKALSRTFTGELIDLLDPRPDQIHIEDIAHHLAMICRFTGSVREFYSVAEHSLNVERLCEETNFRLEALLHDASEAYLNDLNGNLKHSIELEGYRKVEKNFEYIIACRFGLKAAGAKSVKTADYIMLEAEGRHLVKGWIGGSLVGIQIPIIKCLTPKQAEKAFISKAKKLLKIA